MQLRRGREFYGKKYDEAVRLYSEGTGVGEIAKRLGISYSAAYHWVKGLRKPEPGSANEFVAFLEKNGPSSALNAAKKFPKHNELFLIASRRGLPVRRMYLGKAYKQLATWYFLPGQEQQLEERIGEMKKKVEGLKQNLRSMV